ncbi:hypothetical protein BC628DRAFT_1416239 [Trametes gibbosa]|nr:hypothetical protein BC628DRAFT_1416239 [Trametes gibbosa]
MAKDCKQTVSEFKYPQDFVPVKGRRGQVYCKICTPPDRPQGQPMSLAAALRHERENSKHQTKLAEVALWDFNREVESDWTTPTVPKGESAWEGELYTSVRLTAYVNFWLDGLEAASRRETPAHMDVFITKYDKEYEEENWQEKFDDWGDNEEEWPVDEYDGVAGYWFAGGSFDPAEGGFDRPVYQPPYQWGPRSHGTMSMMRIAVERKYWPDDVEADWGPLPGEDETLRKTGQSQPSDATPPQSSETRPSQRNKRRRRQRGRGQRKQAGKGGHVPDSVTRRVEAQQGQRANMY